MADYPIVLPQQLSPVLKALRRSRRLTQREVARRLGVTRQAIGALERQPELATFRRLLDYCAVLGVHLVLRGRDELREGPT